jgi:hypothetical protein
MPAPIAPAAAAATVAGGTPAPVQTSAGKAPIAEPSKAGPEGAPPKATEAPKPAEPPRRLKGKYKDNGKDVEVDLDEAEALREIQKARHYDRTRPEAEQRARRLQETIDAITRDAKGFLKKNGIDIKQLAAEELAYEAEMAKLSPEARRAAELEQELNQTREEIKARDAKETQAREQADQAQRVEGVKTQLRNVMQAIGRRDGHTMRLAAEVIELATRAGEPDLSTEQLVAGVHRLEAQRVLPFVKRALGDAAWRAKNPEVMKELAQGILGALEGDELVDFIGAQNGERIAKAQLAKFRKNPLPLVAGAEPQAPAPKPSEGKKERPPSASVWNMLDQLA